jgi:RNA polymerase sigma-70 factor (ECF subfamily)
MAGDPTLAELIQRVARGERDALRAVYQREATRLFGVARAILREPDGAADAMQTAFLRVWERAGQFDPARGEARAWLAGIVRFAALDAARARGREVLSDDPELGEGEVEPEALARLTREEDGRRLRACLDRLEETQRRGVVLAFVHGLSHAELAAKLDAPLGTVKSWIRRGLMNLRECLA